jgi:hypothetical protein
MPLSKQIWKLVYLNVQLSRIYFLFLHSKSLLALLGSFYADKHFISSRHTALRTTAGSWGTKAVAFFRSRRDDCMSRISFSFFDTGSDKLVVIMGYPKTFFKFSSTLHWLPFKHGKSNHRTKQCTSYEYFVQIALRKKVLCQHPRIFPPAY